jgi:hypothetical protein
MIHHITIEAQKRQAVNDIRDPHGDHGPDKELMTFNHGDVELIITADEFEEYLRARELTWESVWDALDHTKMTRMIAWFREEETLYTALPDPEITRLQCELREMTQSRDALQIALQMTLEEFELRLKTAETLAALNAPEKRTGVPAAAEEVAR